MSTPALAIAALAAIKPEGDSGSTAFTFTVTRSGELSAASTVAYAVTGSGANAADFGGTLPAGTVNFAAGETSKTVTFNVAGDTTVEADEGFTVMLSNPGNGTIVTAATTGTILNDDYNIMFGKVFLSTSGNDKFTGTLGIDTVSYEKAPASVTVNLAVTTAQTTRHGIDTLVNIDNLIGSDFNDRLRGNGGDNILEGGAGTDTLTGGNGSDLYYIDNAGDIVTETNAAAAGGTDTVYTKVNHTLSANVENLRILTAGAVNGTGNTLNNILYAGAGNNVLNGDAGIDTASYAYATSGVTASIAIAGVQATKGSGSDTLLNFENLTGGNFNDTLTGNAAANVIIGGLGNDILNGGAGSDTASYDTATAGVKVNLGLTVQQNTINAGLDTLSKFENLTGSNFKDTLTGNAGANAIIGGLGNDILNGGAGSDTASYATATAGVKVNLGLVVQQNTVSAGLDTLLNFENLTGSNFNDKLAGNATANTIIGGLGNDILNGGAGSDMASYATATAGVTVNLVLTVRQNTVSAGLDTLSNFENLTGSNFNDTLTGNAAANTIIGGLGNDILFGKAGNDTLTGGTGTDIFVFDIALNAITNNDNINNFSVVDDTIRLENAIFAKFTTPGALAAGNFVSSAGAVALDSNDYLLYNTADGSLYYDADGSGAGARVEFVSLTGIPVLTAADFVIV